MEQFVVSRVLLVATTDEMDGRCSVNGVCGMVPMAQPHCCRAIVSGGQDA